MSSRFSKDLYLGKRNARKVVSYNEEGSSDEEPPKKRPKQTVTRNGRKKKKKITKQVKNDSYVDYDDDEGDDPVILELDTSSSDVVLMHLTSDEEDDDDNENNSDNGSSDGSEENEELVEATSDDTNSPPSIDKLLAVRNMEKKQEYLIKWKYKSYWHVTWMPCTELEEIPGGKTRIRHFHPSSFEEFDPRFAQIDRIIGEDESTSEYLCKWTILDYDQSTWESEEEVKKRYENKIEEFYKRETLPPKKQMQPFKRPRPKEFDADRIQIPTFKGDRTLHDYQEDGLKWLTCCWYAQRSSILADEMGLGKTIQTVAILEYLHKAKGNRGPFMVVAPVSTLEQWRREIESWTDLNCVLYHGSAASREIIREQEWRFSGTKKYRQLFKFQVLVTSFQTVSTDSEYLSKIKWQYLVVDEGHRLKNTKSKLFVCLQNFHTEHRLILTGTPLQNNIKELWAILNFVDPEKFAEVEEFEELYGNVKDSRHRKRLQKILSAYLLRRLKEHVFKEIPAKEETIIETELTAIQKRFYKAILERNRDFLCKGLKASNMPSLNNIMIELRKCCNHPFLIKGAEEKIVGFDRNISLEAMINSSAKLIILDKLLSKLRVEGHQVLVFSQMTKLLNILEDYLLLKSYPYERLDGNVNLTDRQSSIDRFSNKENDNFVFLLSTRAGGLGLNLTAANTAVIFDSDWNPQNDLQAQARCHRIGQTETVKIYRLVTKNTYEEYMLSVASKKLGLEMVVLSSEDSSGGVSKLDKKEVDHLLKYGAYHLFNSSEEEDKDEETKLLSEDINSILDRATTVTYDDMGEKESPLGTLSKVTYQIDLEDETFWDSVLPEHKTSPVLLKQLKANEDNEFAKDEVRKQFLEDVHAVVEDVKELLAARSKSFAFNTQGPTLSASNLIDAIIDSDHFTAEEKVPLYTLQSSIISTKRERKTVDRSNQMVDTGLNDVQKPQKKEKLPTLTPAEAKREAELKKEVEWSKLLRDKVKTALTSLGPGRWRQIAQFVFSADGTAKSKTGKQIRALCESMMQQYFGREDIGCQLIDLKDELPLSSPGRTFYGKWVQGESEVIIQQLLMQYKNNPFTCTADMKAEWAKVSLTVSDQYSTTDVKPKHGADDDNDNDDDDDSSEVEDTYESGQRVTVHFEQFPHANSEAFVPVFLIIRLVHDNKKEGDNCIIRATFIDAPISSQEITVPGFVGEYRVQLWSPVWTKSPVINTKKGPYATFRVQCPSVLDKVTRFAVQKWTTQCEFMKALELYLASPSHFEARPSKQPAWWWNVEYDAYIFKGIYRHGYGRFNVVRNDPGLEMDEKSLEKRFKEEWEQKKPIEQQLLGFMPSDGSIPSSKKKLRENPYEFPTTASLNSYMKSFLKLHNLIGNDVSAITPTPKAKAPKGKAPKGKVTAPKRKVVAEKKKKVAVSSVPSAPKSKKTSSNSATSKSKSVTTVKPRVATRDSSPETFVKKKPSKKKKKSVSSGASISL